MTYHHLAFFMGLFGSVHCAAMCGPLLLALGGSRFFSWGVLFAKLLYQSGRILTYGLLGLLLGLFGNIAGVQGWQQGFSICIGVLLVAVGLFSVFGKRSRAFAGFQAKAVRPFARLMGRWLYRPGGAFVAGVLNGMLPCGMVYMAIASAMNADSPVGGFLFMVLFGLGTLPLLLAFSFAGSFPRSVLKRGFSRIVPLLYVLMGVWFILRGANLDIPYLSPLLHVEGALDCG